MAIARGIELPPAFEHFQVKQASRGNFRRESPEDAMRTTFLYVAIAVCSAPLLAEPAAAQFFAFFGKQPVCSQQYHPVCAVRNGARRTYSNSCTAAAAGAQVIHQGQCRRAARAQQVPVDQDTQPPN